MLRIITLAILGALSGGLATAGQARDFKDYPEWVCAYGYNAGGQNGLGLWRYGSVEARCDFLGATCLPRQIGKVRLAGLLPTVVTSVSQRSASR